MQAGFCHTQKNFDLYSTGLSFFASPNARAGRVDLVDGSGQQWTSSTVLKPRVPNHAGLEPPV
jgi:hypothetical protein